MKLIKKQDRFILVNDQEIKKGDLCIYPDLIIVRTSMDLDRRDLKKVIAGVEFLPDVDFSKLRKKDLLMIIESVTETEWNVEVNANNQITKIVQ